MICGMDGTEGDGYMVLLRKALCLGRWAYGALIAGSAMHALESLQRLKPPQLSPPNSNLQTYEFGMSIPDFSGFLSVYPLGPEKWECIELLFPTGALKR